MTLERLAVHRRATLDRQAERTASGLEVIRLDAVLLGDLLQRAVPLASQHALEREQLQAPLGVRVRELVRRAAAGDQLVDEGRATGARLALQAAQQIHEPLVHAGSVS